MRTTNWSGFRYALIGALAASSVLIAACGGGGDDAVGDIATAAADQERAQALATPNDTPTWTRIAGEGGSFTVDPNTVVRYGAGTRWIEKTVSGAGWCTNAFFGSDPAVGVTKQCQVQVDVQDPPPGSWVKIAGEGQSFSVAPNTLVRYGVNASWIEKTVSGAGWCTNAFFGRDPAVGITKQCQVQATPEPPPEGHWVKIAKEYESFSVGTSQRVRYGRDTKWVEKTMSGAGQCTNKFFGMDPAYGMSKQCDLFTFDEPPPQPPPPPPPSDYGPPIVISKGGTYSANWESLDPTVPAVKVTTTEPVIIENCRLRGKGHLVSSLNSGTNITVRNCIGQGLNPNVVNNRMGRFVTVYKPATLIVERNTLLGTAGIYADGAGTSANRITVRYNRAQNIDGRLSDGKGGYLNTSFIAQFLQLNNVRATKNIEVAWNQVINEPGKSRVEENINLYLSSGTADSPIRIHDNYIQGAYGADPVAPGYSGGGMIVDGGTSDLKAAAGWVQMHDNQIVGTQNQGIAIAAGHDVDVRNNRVIGSGLLPDGRRMPSANVGIYVSNSYGFPATFFNNVVKANTVGWINNAGRLNNFWFPGCSGSNCQGNYPLPAPITLAMEAAEFSGWTSKLATHGIVVGSSLEN